MPEIDDKLIRYLAARDAERDDRVSRTLDALTNRERVLVREAAVMGYVQGVMAARAKDFTIPKDSTILWRVIAGCQTFFDTYPLLGVLPGEEAEDR